LYRGRLVPRLRDKLVFGDITTGRIWYAHRADVLAADDDDPATVAPIYEVDADLRRITEETYRKRGGTGQTLPGFAAIAGRGRVDLRFAEDNDGELYLLTKSDGMIRKVVGARAATATTPAAATAATVPAQEPRQSAAARPATPSRNPVASTRASIAAGKRVYDVNCAACHGNRAQGAVKAGTPISIIEDSRGKQPPDLTDGQWDHGSRDGDVFGVIKRGVPSTMMPSFDGRIADREIWHVVNYLRSLRPRRTAAAPLLKGAGPLTKRHSARNVTAGSTAAARRAGK